MEELKQCLNCKTKPCTTGCPLGNNIPMVISLLKNSEYKQAYEELTKTTVLPAICGRICPYMSQCMGKCVKGIKRNAVKIGEIEQFIGDMAINENLKLSKINDDVLQNKKVAVIGSGPAGLTCAAFLARQGVQVTIYEKFNKLGGILRYGIPEFRLDKTILDKSIDKIINLGIEVKYNCELGKDIFLEQLKKAYDGIFISIGANIPCSMGIPGENLKGVYGGNILLQQIQILKEDSKQIVPDFNGKKVAIIGGGNVAMDCARVIKKLGASNVKIIYRRAIEQMPAEKKEIQEAMEEGIEFLFQNNIIKIIGNSNVEKIECVKTKLVQKEGQDRLVPINVENSNYIIDVDNVIMAIGSKPDDVLMKCLNLDLDKYNYIVIDENYKTSDSKVWAGGDIANCKATVAWAALAGRNVAENIANYLKI